MIISLKNTVRMQENVESFLDFVKIITLNFDLNQSKKLILHKTSIIMAIL